MLFTTKKTAEYLGGISNRTLERWRLEGLGPVWIKLGKSVRYRKSDLDEYLSSQVRSSTSQV